MNFITHFSVLKDPRTKINIKYNFLDIIFLVISAMLSQAEDREDIEDFGKERRHDWLSHYGRRHELSEKSHPINHKEKG